MGKHDPYVKCDHCDVIVRKSNKARHLKVKHKDIYKGRVVYEKINCYCGKRFSPSHLKTHWKKHHMEHSSLEHYRWQIKTKIIEAGRTFSEFFNELRRRRKLRQKKTNGKEKKVNLEENIVQKVMNQSLLQMRAQTQKLTQKLNV